LVGHGPAAHGPQAASALREALARSRGDIPRLALKGARADALGALTGADGSH
jgi:hypothetical protein